MGELFEERKISERGQIMNDRADRRAMIVSHCEGDARRGRETRAGAYRGPSPSGTEVDAASSWREAHYWPPSSLHRG